MSNGVPRCDGPTEKYHQLCRSPQLYGTFEPHLVHSFTLLTANSHQSYFQRV